VARPNLGLGMLHCGIIENNIGNKTQIGGWVHYIIGGGELKIDPTKMEAIMKW